jgi:hypothetical protein
MRSLGDLRRRLDRAGAAAQPRAGRRHRLTTAEGRQKLDQLVQTVDLMFGVGAVLARLEEWAAQRPGYVAMGPPTVPYEPDAADIRMAVNNPALAGLAEPHLTHAPEVRAARLAQLLERYRRAGQPDEATEAALADFRERLAAFEATGATIGPWYARFVDPIATDNSAGS